MFSLVRTLSSPTSVEGCPPLLGWFIGTTARSDPSRACMSDVRLCTFSDRPRSPLDRGTPEVSRFSCMLFFSVGRCFDYAGPADRSRLAQPAVLPSLYHYEVSTLIRVFRSSIARPLSMLRPTPRDAVRKARGQDGFAFSFLVGLLHSQQHAGLSRRTMKNALPVSNHGNSQETFELRRCQCPPRFDTPCAGVP